MIIYKIHNISELKKSDQKKLQKDQIGLTYLWGKAEVSRKC